MCNNGGNFLQRLLEGTPHDLLYLPPYHAHYNPIELVWGLVKRYYDTHVGRNNDYSNKMCEKIIAEAVAKVTPTVWANTVAKVEANIFKDCYNHVPKDFYAIKPIIVYLGDDDEDSDPDPDEPDADFQPLPSHTPPRNQEDMNAPINLNPRNQEDMNAPNNLDTPRKQEDINAPINLDNEYPSGAILPRHPPTRVYCQQGNYSIHYKISISDKGHA